MMINTEMPNLKEFVRYKRIYNQDEILNYFKNKIDEDLLDINNCKIHENFSRLILADSDFYTNGGWFLAENELEKDEKLLFASNCHTDHFFITNQLKIIILNYTPHSNKYNHPSTNNPIHFDTNINYKYIKKDLTKQMKRNIFFSLNPSHAFFSSTIIGEINAGPKNGETLAKSIGIIERELSYWNIKNSNNTKEEKIIMKKINKEENEFQYGINDENLFIIKIINRNKCKEYKCEITNDILTKHQIIKSFDILKQILDDGFENKNNVIININKILNYYKIEIKINAIYINDEIEFTLNKVEQNIDVKTIIKKIDYQMEKYKNIIEEMINSNNEKIMKKYIDLSLHVEDNICNLKKNIEKIEKEKKNKGPIKKIRITENDIELSSCLNPLYTKDKLIDGKEDTFVHTSSNHSVPEFIKITLPKEKDISKIIIQNRKNCCQHRILNCHLKLIDNENQLITDTKIIEINQTYIFEFPKPIENIKKIILEKDDIGRGDEYAINISGIEIYEI
jgi:hypothetical protein